MAKFTATLLRVGVMVVLLAAATVWLQQPASERPRAQAYPNDWFFMQRAFPVGRINIPVYRQGIRQAQAMQAALAPGAVPWQPAGPTNIGGRITDVEMSPSSFDTIYAGCAAGGVFRSDDGGQNWISVFDQAASLSVGDIALDPTNPRIVYVGTGEVNAGGGSLTYPGFGLYRSTDAGGTWEELGLQDSRYIGRIAVDPANPQRIYAAVMGKLFERSATRGLYRSTDNGASWERRLFISDSTGCIDVTLNRQSPNIVYAAMWERLRRPHRRSYGGVTSGIYRSTDGGETWSELINGLPHGSPQVGRIGLAISPSNPEILYAIYADNIGPFAGVFKSTDGGDSWVRTNDGALSGNYSSFGWWFGNMRVDPTNPQVAYVLGLNIYKTTNGGQSWFFSSGNIHVDQHGLYIHPQNPNYLVAGNDGGIYISQNGGASYAKSFNLPITQFYTSEVDFQFPQRLYGGTQDNGTNRTLSGDPAGWTQIFGGDGFYVLVDPTDNRFIYAESQNGNLGRSTNGGQNFLPARAGISGADRNNWNSPLTMSPLNPRTLYFGTHRVYKTTNRAVSWLPISGDLTNGPGGGNLTFGTVTTIAAAASDSNVVYAGTDDGNVWVTTDGGQNWTHISAGLPQRWVTRVAVDPRAALTAYVTISGYRWDDYLPHIFRTTNGGAAWQDVSANLPEVPLNDVIVDPDRDSTLYVASDVGVFVSDDPGGDWRPLGTGLPNVPVNDLTLHNPTRVLIAATYGRSQYRLDLSEVTAVHAPAGTLPLAVELAQNYPNPFNGETVIQFRLRRSADVRMEIFDMLGRRVRRLAAGSFSAGDHQLSWDGRDDQGRGLASGNYIYRLRAGEALLSRKMMLLK